MEGKRASLAAFVAGLAGSAVLGVIAGLIWAAVAPRPLFQVVQGGANQVNAEDSSYIVADLLFGLIAAVGGLITGLAGSRMVKRYDWPAALGLVLGAVAAGFLARWVGESVHSLSAFQHQVAVGAMNSYLHGNLSLGAGPAIACWPLVTSVIIAMIASSARRREEEGPLASVSTMWTPGQAGGHAP